MGGLVLGLQCCFEARIFGMAGCLNPVLALQAAYTAVCFLYGIIPPCLSFRILEMTNAGRGLRLRHLYTVNAVYMLAHGTHKGWQHATAARATSVVETANKTQKNIVRQRFDMTHTYVGEWL